VNTGSNGFGYVDDRLRAGVERLIVGGHDPDDAMAGCRRPIPADN
jgi:hypothetical protein